MSHKVLEDGGVDAGLCERTASSIFRERVSGFYVCMRAIVRARKRAQR